jgi:diamine N-acetyltransferase
MPTPNCKLPDPRTLYKNTGDEKIPAYIQEAGDFLASGEAKSCIDHLNLAASKNVESQWGWIVAATAHCQLGNFEMAIKVSERGLQYSGENSYLFDCSGVAYAGMGDLIHARDCFLKAVKTNPENTSSIINLANIYLSHNEIDSAFEVLDQGLKNNPADAEIKYLYIQLHPAWISPLENGRIRIRVRTPLDDPFVLHCYANEAFMDNYNRYLASAFRQSKATKNPHLRSRLNVYKNHCVQWVIERINHSNPGEPGYTCIGLASLAEIQLTHRRAEILIGFPDAKLSGSGIPLAAMLMILDFAFNTIGFNKLTSIVYSDNVYAQKSTLAIGFKQEGFFRNHLFDSKSNSWLSIYQNAMLIEEFRKNTQLAKVSKKLLGYDPTQERLSLFGKLDLPATK